MPGMTLGCAQLRKEEIDSDGVGAEQYHASCCDPEACSYNTVGASM